jgi:alpha-1,2-mannosyltransferase
MSAGTTTPPVGHRRGRWARVAVAAAVVAAYLAGLLWYGDTQHSFDLRIYYHAVAWWADGHPLYDYAQPDKVQGSLSFTYPPFAALVMLPMLLAGLPATVVVFWVLNLAAAALLAWWLVTPVAARHGWPAWFAGALAVPVVLGLDPVRETATYGQVNLLLAVLVLADLLFAVPRRSRLAGVGVGVAAAIKLTPAVFVVYLLVTRRFRAAATAVVAFLAATGLGALYQPGDTWRFYTSVMWGAGRVGHLDRVNNQSLMGGLARLVAPHPPSGLVWALLVAAVAAFGLYRAAAAARAGDEVAGVTLTGLTGALASPVSWNHHLLWFAPALLVLVDAATSGGRRRGWYAALAVTVWASVTYGVVQVFDYHLLPFSAVRTPAGQVLADWYLLLMLLLLAALPVRDLPPGEPPAAWRPPAPPTARDRATPGGGPGVHPPG